MKRRLLGFLFIYLFTLQANANQWKDGTHPDLCKSTPEFTKTLNFLRTFKELDGNEAVARDIALQVSSKCNGAYERFTRTLLLLTGSGVNTLKSIEIAVDFAGESDQTINNFYEIFQKTFLTEYFNLEFSTALEISYSLSKDFQGDPATAREDFLNLTRFCLEEKSMGLSVHDCAKFSVTLARLSQHYPKGVYAPFEKTYQTLRQDKSFGVSVQEALNIIARVFSHGPTAPENFTSAFEFAMKKEGLNMKARDALKFALQMAERSSRGLPPPIYVPEPKPEEK